MFSDSQKMKPFYDRYLELFDSKKEIDWAVDEAQLLVADILLERIEGVHPNGDRQIDQSDESDLLLRSILDGWAMRRSQGEPLQYIFGHWPFFELDLICDSRALIPRPETEGLVELVISDCRRNGSNQLRVLDLGAGTGAIGLSIAASKVASSVVLVDFSEAACALTLENLTRNSGKIACLVEVIQSDWFEKLSNRSFDVIVSNPPYIRSAEIASLQVELAMEPRSALDGGEDGLDPYRKIISSAKEYLNDGGVVYFEIGFDQGDDLIAIGKSSGFGKIEVIKDFAAHDRYVKMSI